MRSVVGVVCLLALAAGCGLGVGSSPHGNGGPPPIRLLGDHPVDLPETSGCWQEAGVGRCVDMAKIPLAQLPRRTGTQVDFDFPIDGTTFEATLTALPATGHWCDRVFRAQVLELGDHYRLEPRAPAGRYRVTVSGAAEQGEVGGEFVWRTASDTAPAPPQATIGVVAAPNDVVEGDGFNLSVTGLPQVHDAQATIRAAASNGNSYQFDAGPAHRRCPGSLYFAEDGIAESHRVATLGEPPFTYDVTLALDGTRYRASAVWPDDHVDDPFNDYPALVSLAFDPPLPQAE